ncbi:hypothetical protein [Aquimarina longa]|uniref:hypothetical protein n=1 Tax=Aquimarina longa TaxID=1080221 RepID=UPI000781018B|nr:hypothetical protein [Aquimarina longa]
MLFYENLQVKLYESKLQKKIDFDFWFSSSIDIENEKGTLLDESYLNILKHVNGFKINWKAKEVDQAYGNVEFLELDVVQSSWEGVVYENRDLKINENLKFFRPFDQVSPEILCGFIMKSDEVFDSIYLHNSGSVSLSYLDVNFEGYITMLYEAKAYKNWPQILLYIQDDQLENDLIKSFQTDMLQLFSDFSWEIFVEKYESLRLSKK